MELPAKLLGLDAPTEVAQQIEAGVTDVVEWEATTDGGAGWG